MPRLRPTSASRAFTLIELIVTIVVLGLLAALAVPAFSAVTARSRDAADEASVEAVGREAAALAAFDGTAVTAAHITEALGDLAGAQESLTAPVPPYVRNPDGEALAPGQWDFVGYAGRAAVAVFVPARMPDASRVLFLTAEVTSGVATWDGLDDDSDDGRAAAAGTALFGDAEAVAAADGSTDLSDSGSDTGGQVAYDGSWQQLGTTMPTGRYAAATTTDADGRIYVAGGYDASTTVVRTLERYDPVTGSWETLAPMPTAVQAAAAAVDDNGRVYVMGGSQTYSYEGRVATVQRFDPTSGAWTTLAPLPEARYMLAGASDDEGRVYAIGGNGATGHANVTRFDPITGAWETLADLPTGRYGTTAVTGGDGRIYVAGGHGTTAQTLERFDPSTGAWESLAGLPASAYRSAGVVDVNGHIWVIGGYSSGALDTVQRYDPTSGAWELMGGLTTPRSHVGAGRDAQGRLYAVGGNGPDGVLNTIERLG